MNAWLGGFQYILNKMTPGNFDWFLHSLLFLHAERVIQKQNERAMGSQQNNDDEEEEEDLGIDIDRE